MDWEKTNGEQTEVDENARQQPNAEGEVTELDEEPGEELETAAEREAREKREEAERREKEKTQTDPCFCHVACRSNRQYHHEDSAL